MPSLLLPTRLVAATTLLLLLLRECPVIRGATLTGHQELSGNAGMPTLTSLDAKCGRSGMTVKVHFDSPFPGVIYSKGHYANKDCNYVTENTSGDTTYTFLIPIDGCGTHNQLQDLDRDMFFENTIIVQMDPLITEVWDEARLLKCVWPKTMLRKVHSVPFEVQQPERVSVQLDQRSINTLMEIQQGPGPFDAPATGYVYMGEDTSVVIYLQDSDHTADANVVNCSATSVGGARVQLIDNFGCLLRPDLITHFDKSRETNGVKADLMLYSYLKAFRIGESSAFTIRCQLEVCNGKCSLPCSNAPVLAKRRRRRSTDPMFSSAALEHHLPTLVDLEQAVLVVERAQIDDNTAAWCSLTPGIVTAALVLLGVVAALSCLSCYLALKLANRTHKTSTFVR